MDVDVKTEEFIELEEIPNPEDSENLQKSNQSVVVIDRNGISKRIMWFLCAKRQSTYPSVFLFWIIQLFQTSD